MKRRDFLCGLGAAGTISAVTATAMQSASFTKSICSVVFPDTQPVLEYFGLVRNAGFHGIELRVGRDIPLSASPEDVRRIRDAAHKADIAVASLWVGDPLQKNPLNSPSQEVRTKGVMAIQRTVELANQLGCSAVLLYPCRLGNGPKMEVGYETTWQRVTRELKKAVPAAQKAKVILTPENVWNKFLVSPLEMRTFLDQFHSPWVQSHFDIGNVMQFGYPQDWILTLGHRIKRVHVKDYKLSTRAEQGRFVKLLEGDVDWKAVMAALTKVGYRGYLSPEISHDPKEPDQLKNISKQLDQIISMA